MNPFLEEKKLGKDHEFSMTAYVRELFSGKKEGDTFEINLHGATPKIVRATIYMVVKQKYKTKMKNGKMYALILNGER